MKYLTHIIIAVVLSMVAFDSAVRLIDWLDDEPVYVVTEEPVVLTPYLHSGDTLRVRWVGYYRRSCPNLQYTRWLGYYVDGDAIFEKFPNVSASSGKATTLGPSVFRWSLPVRLDPGVYFWRSIEIADCGHGIIHRNHLDDAWFEVVPDSEAATHIQEE